MLEAYIIFKTQFYGIILTTITLTIKIHVHCLGLDLHVRHGVIRHLESILEVGGGGWVALVCE